MYDGIHSEAGCFSGGLPEFLVVRQCVEPIDGEKCQHLAQHQDPAHVGDEGKITVAETQPVGQGAVASQWAKLEAVPTHACLVSSWLAWQVSHRLVGSAEHDGCPAVETGGEVEEVKEPDEDNGEGSNEPRDECRQLEGLSSSSYDTGDKKRRGRRLCHKVAIVFFGDRLLHHEHKSVREVRKAWFEPFEERFPEVRAAPAENADTGQEDTHPEGS